MNLSNRFWIGPVALLGIALVGVAAFVFSKPSTAAPVIQWAPSSVTQTILPGQSRAIPVSFAALTAISNAAVSVVPELQSLVTVTPSTLTNIHEGQVVTFSLIVAPSVSAPLGVTEGTVHVVVNQRTIAQPLPVTVNVTLTFTNAAGGYSLTVPRGWQVDTGLDATSSTVLSPPGRVADPSNEYVGDVFVDSIPNPSNLDLADFYQSAANVNLFSASVTQTPFYVNGLPAYRFESVGGMLPSTVVAVKANGRVIEITDFNEAQQADGVFDFIVSTFVATP